MVRDGLHVLTADSVQYVTVTHDDRRPVPLCGLVESSAHPGHYGYDTDVPTARLGR